MTAVTGRHQRYPSLNASLYLELEMPRLLPLLVSAAVSLAVLMSLQFIGGTQQWTAVGVSHAQTMPAYPLKLSANHRYLVDQNGQPFFINGDAPWSLIVQG